MKFQRPGNSVSRVERYLERRIIEGEFKAGQRLIQNDISRRLGLSRAPVREALRALTADGLIEFHPRRGWRVSGLGPDEVRDTFLVFETLETLSTGLAASRISDAQVEMLRRLVATMQPVVSANDVAAYFALNTRFHETIYRAAANRPLMRLLLGLDKQLTRFRFAALATPGRMAASLQEHRVLVEALARREPDEAVQLARRSVADARRALLTHLGAADNILPSTLAPAGNGVPRRGSSRDRWLTAVTAPERRAAAERPAREPVPGRVARRDRRAVPGVDGAGRRWKALMDLDLVIRGGTVVTAETTD